MSGPLVTCACLTRDRREWLRLAIDCFLRQTYEPRELLVVDTSREPVADLIPNDPRISCMRLGWSSLTVGALRNLAAEAARGEIVAHWDDDDYSAPGRLAHQVERLSGDGSGPAVTGFHSMKFVDMRGAWWQYRGSPMFALGTSLCYWRGWWAAKPFTEIQVGQDEAFSIRARAEGKLAADEDLDLMYATIHAGNTSPRDTKQAMWKALPGFAWKEAA